MCKCTYFYQWIILERNNNTSCPQMNPELLKATHNSTAFDTHKDMVLFLESSPVPGVKMKSSIHYELLTHYNNASRFELNKVQAKQSAELFSQLPSPEIEPDLSPSVPDNNETPENNLVPSNFGNYSYQYKYQDDGSFEEDQNREYDCHSEPFEDNSAMITYLRDIDNDIDGLQEDSRDDYAGDYQNDWLRSFQYILPFYGEDLHDDRLEIFKENFQCTKNDSENIRPFFSRCSYSALQENDQDDCQIDNCHASQEDHEDYNSLDRFYQHYRIRKWPLPFGIAAKSQQPPTCWIAAGKKIPGGRFVFGKVLLLFQFLVLPTSAQVAVIPNEAVAGINGAVAFTCISTSAQSIGRVEWLINGTSLNDGHRSDGVTQERDILLQFSNVAAEYNNTMIQCIGDNVTSSDTAMLLVQGLLAAVGSLMVHGGVDHIYVNWTAPFTLDIQISSVDITYCVDVVSSTSSATLHSECGITETEFTYPLPPRSWCHEYKFTVTPVNVVGNGTAKSTQYLQDLIGLKLLEKTTTSVTTSLLMSAPVCDAELMLVDVDTGKNFTLGNSNLTITETNITFSTQQLNVNRRYNVTGTASNIREAFSFNNSVISTHDIQSCSTSTEVNVTVVANFTEHSNATGALLIFVFINDDNATINFAKSVCQIANKTDVTQGLTLPLSMLYSGRYVLYAYDIENNKKVMNGIGYQASSGTFEVYDGQAQTSSASTDCNITSLAGVITAACTFARFQVVAQLNGLDNVSILHVSTSLGTHTPVTLQVCENGEYLVTILPIQDDFGIMLDDPLAWTLFVANAQTTQGTTSSPTTSLTGASGLEISPIVVGVVVGVCALGLLIVSLLIAVCFVYKKRPKRVHVLSGTAANITGSDLAHSEDTRCATHAHTRVTSPNRADQVCFEVSSPTYRPSTESFPHSNGMLVTTSFLPSDERVASHLPTTSLQRNIDTTSDIDAIPVQFHDIGSASFVIEPTAYVDMPEESTDVLQLSVLNAEGEKDASAINHYVALDHPAKPVSSDDEVTNIHNIEYATPKGYKNKHNQTYAIINLKESSDKGCLFEFSKGIGDDVVYSEVAQVPKKKSKDSERTPGKVTQGQEQRQPIQDERSCGDTTSFRLSENNYASGAVVQRFPWTSRDQN